MSESGWTSIVGQLEDAPPDPGRSGQPVPDRRDGAVYVMDSDLTLAVDVALATRRPLLLRGDPGTGKSSVAAYVARNLGWRYYEHVVTARSTARDLLYTFDSVRKLADASAAQKDAEALDDSRYLEPGVFWWAFDRESARRRGVPANRPAPPEPLEPDAAVNQARSARDAVVLIDEIDKADPDLPNGLLVPLGSGEFRATETNTLVTRHGADFRQGAGTRQGAGARQGAGTRQGAGARQGAGTRRADGDGSDADGSTGRLLVIITTNQERDLPQAFERRCVTHTLKAHGRSELFDIGLRHLAAERVARTPDVEALVAALADKIIDLRHTTAAGRRPPSTAEFLDAVHACLRLDVRVGDPMWTKLESLVLRKPTDEGKV